MFQNRTKFRLIFFVALVIGGIGAGGQTFLLYHELVHTYPYKMMDSNLYESIAVSGVYFAPSIAIIGGWFFGIKRTWLASIIPVFLCPLLFTSIFKTVSIVHKWNGGMETGWSFDGITPAMAAQDFLIYSVTLTILGSVIGAVFSLLFWYLSKERKLI